MPNQTNSTEPKRIAEVVDSSTDHFVAQCYWLYEAPALGSLVRSGKDEGVYALVSSITTSSIDPGRRPIARGLHETSEEDVYRANPQLERLLRTDFRATIVGFRSNNVVYQYLPPLPPRIHGFVHYCQPQEVRNFTENLDFLNYFVQSFDPVSDEVAAAFLCQAATAHEDAENFLTRSAQQISRLLSHDMVRLNTVLRRLTL